MHSPQFQWNFNLLLCTRAQIKYTNIDFRCATSAPCNQPIRSIVFHHNQRKCLNQCIFVLKHQLLAFVDHPRFPFPRYDHAIDCACIQMFRIHRITLLADNFVRGPLEVSDPFTGRCAVCTNAGIPNNE